MDSKSNIRYDISSDEKDLYWFRHVYNSIPKVDGKKTFVTLTRNASKIGNSSCRYAHNKANPTKPSSYKLVDDKYTMCSYSDIDKFHIYDPSDIMPEIVWMKLINMHNYLVGNSLAMRFAEGYPHVKTTQEEWVLYSSRINDILSSHGLYSISPIISERTRKFSISFASVTMRAINDILLNAKSTDSISIVRGIRDSASFDYYQTQIAGKIDITSMRRVMDRTNLAMDNIVYTITGNNDYTLKADNNLIGFKVAFANIFIDCTATMRYSVSTDKVSEESEPNDKLRAEVGTTLETLHLPYGDLALIQFGKVDASLISNGGGSKDIENKYESKITEILDLKMASYIVENNKSSNDLEVNNFTGKIIGMLTNQTTWRNAKILVGVTVLMGGAQILTGTQLIAQIIGVIESAYGVSSSFAAIAPMSGAAPGAMATLGAPAIATLGGITSNALIVGISKFNVGGLVDPIAFETFTNFFTKFAVETPKTVLSHISNAISGLNITTFDIQPLLNSLKLSISSITSSISNYSMAPLVTVYSYVQSSIQNITSKIFDSATYSKSDVSKVMSGEKYDEFISDVKQTIDNSKDKNTQPDFSKSKYSLKLAAAIAASAVVGATIGSGFATGATVAGVVAGLSTTGSALGLGLLGATSMGSVVAGATVGASAASLIGGSVSAGTLAGALATTGASMGASMGAPATLGIIANVTSTMGSVALNTAWTVGSAVLDTTMSVIGYGLASSASPLILAGLAGITGYALYKYGLISAFTGIAKGILYAMKYVFKYATTPSDPNDNMSYNIASTVKSVLKNAGNILYDVTKSAVYIIGYVATVAANGIYESITYKPVEYNIVDGDTFLPKLMQSMSKGQDRIFSEPNASGSVMVYKIIPISYDLSRLDIDAIKGENPDITLKYAVERSILTHAVKSIVGKLKCTYCEASNFTLKKVFPEIHQNLNNIGDGFMINNKSIIVITDIDDEMMESTESNVNTKDISSRIEEILEFNHMPVELEYTPVANPIINIPGYPNAGSSTELTGGIVSSALIALNNMAINDRLGESDIDMSKVVISSNDDNGGEEEEIPTINSILSDTNVSTQSHNQNKSPKKSNVKGVNVKHIRGKRQDKNHRRHDIQSSGMPNPRAKIPQ